MNMRLPILKTCSIALAVASLALAAAAVPPKGAIEKKIIAFGWEFGQVSTISNLLLYADAFDATPLDGVGFMLSEIPCADGLLLSTRHIMHDRPWRYSEVAHLVPKLKALTAHRSMRECFIGSLRSPTNRIDWTGPYAWRTEGDLFSYDYLLVPLGIMRSPFIIVK